MYKSDQKADFPVWRLEAGLKKKDHNTGLQSFCFSEPDRSLEKKIWDSFKDGNLK